MEPRGSVACGLSLPTFVQLKKIVADSVDFDDLADYFLAPDLSGGLI